MCVLMNMHSLVYTVCRCVTFNPFAVKLMRTCCTIFAVHVECTAAVVTQIHTQVLKPGCLGQFWPSLHPSLFNKCYAHT